MREPRWWIGVLGALVMALGCGDDDGNQGGQGSSAAATCARSCSKAAAAKCPNQPANCQQQCEQQIDATPAGCLGAVNAYATCINGAVFSCDGQGLAEATSCAEELSVWLACLGVSPGGNDAGGPIATPDAAVDARISFGDASTVADSGSTPDASSDAGSDASTGSITCAPEPGDPACRTCLKQQCCPELSQCDASCQGLLDCSNACPIDEDGSCSEACITQYPGGFTGVTLIAQCLDESCAAACEE